jgi:hypothetical protein
MTNDINQEENKVDSNLFTPEIVISDNNIPTETPVASLDEAPQIQGLNGQNDDTLDENGNYDDQNVLQTEYDNEIKDSASSDDDIDLD